MSPFPIRFQARRELLNPIHMMKTLWRHRELTTQLTVREVAGRYKNTYLGLVWSIFIPLSLLAVYTFVFGVIFTAKWRVIRTPSRLEYALTLFCGIILFTVFSETVGRCTQVIIYNANYVKKVVFPLEILPVVQLGSSLIHGMLSMLIWLAGMLLFVSVPPSTVIYFPIVLFELCAFTVGIGWLVSALGVFIRDINQAVMIILQVLFFCSAVFFSIMDVPARLRWIVDLNPLALIMENTRRTLMWGQPPDWTSLLVILAISLVTMQLGYYFFMRSKRVFSDVL